MYHYVLVHELYRQRVAELEREAAIRRQLPPRRRRHLPRPWLAFHGLRSEAPRSAALAAGPRSCR